uniref:Uncharacterized protein n=1 Tax=Araucaria cunninghamii TaxID=56994 RepID=A0A0D6R7P1_ARACU
MATTSALTRPLSVNTLLSSKQCSKRLGLQSYRLLSQCVPNSALKESHTLRKRQLWVCSAMDAAIGGAGQMGRHPVFPHIYVWDPYKRLGVGRDASEEEIREARNFLLEQYAGHERSVESIEAAYDKIIMSSFRERKRSKFNFKSKLKKKVEESPPWIRQMFDIVEVPPSEIITRRAALFLFIGVWSIVNSTEAGPAFQVAVALAACIFFLNMKTKSIARSGILGLVGLAAGWVVGSLVVPGIPTYILPPTWTLELCTALISYVFLFLACTFLK